MMNRLALQVYSQSLNDFLIPALNTSTNSLQAVSEYRF